MKRKIAVFFMLMFLISTTEFGQLLKFPLLVEHYIEHKGLNPDLSIWGFLQIHYDNNHKEDGDPTDEKLPFVSHAPIIHLVATTPPTMLKIDRVKIPTNNTPVESFHDTVFESSFLSSIWQPPKTLFIHLDSYLVHLFPLDDVVVSYLCINSIAVSIQ